MKNLFLILVIMLTGCECDCPECQNQESYNQEQEQENYIWATTLNENDILPESLRRWNRDGGSCVHVSTEYLLLWQRKYELADWWHDSYKGGEYSDRLIRRMESAGLSYAYTTHGDLDFIEWAIRTRRGAGIFYKPNHAINIVGLDSESAYLLDNNNIHKIEKVPRNIFIYNWKNRYGGFAWTLVYTPPPPVPIYN